MNGAWYVPIEVHNVSAASLGNVKVGSTIDIITPGHTTVGSSWGSISWSSCKTTQVTDAAAKTTCTISALATTGDTLSFGVSAKDEAGTKASGTISIG
jgi:hypothetical protein